jgi:site-specific recombinase XerC
MSEMMATSTALVAESAANVNPAAVYLAGLAPTGRRSMASALGSVARIAGFDGWQSMPWGQLRYAHVTALRTKLEEQGLAPASVNRALSAIRGVMAAAGHAGQITAEELAHIRAVKGVTASTLPAGRAIPSGELAAMMRACAVDPTRAGVRDGAIIALAYSAGLRRAEIAGLTLEALAADDGETVIIRLMGKRRKEREVPIANGGAAALRDWLTVRGHGPGPLFWRGRKGGQLEPRGMTAQAVRDIIERRALQAGVAMPVRPHDLRRSFVTDLLEAGTDIATVARMAGHDSVTTTQRYDRRGEQAKRKAVLTLHVPYVRRTLG